MIWNTKIKIKQNIHSLISWSFSEAKTVLILWFRLLIVPIILMARSRTIAAKTATALIIVARSWSKVVTVLSGNWSRLWVWRITVAITAWLMAVGPIATSLMITVLVLRSWVVAVVVSGIAIALAVSITAAVSLVVSVSICIRLSIVYSLYISGRVVWNHFWWNYTWNQKLILLFMCIYTRSRNGYYRNEYGCRTGNERGHNWDVLYHVYRNWLSCKDELAFACAVWTLRIVSNKYHLKVSTIENVILKKI